MKEAGERNPYKHTDILGAAELCAEELSVAPPGTRKTVVILSDFIQDDRQLNFIREPRLAASDRAAPFAAELARTRQPSFEDASVYLGFLRSEDLKKLPESRRAALRAFWIEFLRARGATQVSTATDGTGQLARFLERVQSGVTTATHNEQ